MRLTGLEICVLEDALAVYAEDVSASTPLWRRAALDLAARVPKCHDMTITGPNEKETTE